MSEQWTPTPGHTREQSAIELTRFLLQKHYWESRAAADESVFDEPFFWFGAAEQEFSVDREAVLSLFRRFVGKVPKCSITEEEFHAAMIAPDACMVAGRFWVATDPATDVYIRFHQRITTCVRWREGKARVCMLHLSNPYSEMSEDDVGFPTQMARESREYMQRQLEEQKRLIARQAAELTDIYNTISCGILRLLRTPDGTYRLLTFNRALASLTDRTEEGVRSMDWSQGFGGDVAAEELPLLRSYLDRLSQPGDHSAMDYRIRTGRGRTVYLHSSNNFVSRGPEGDVIQRLTYDVTDRVRLEHALKRMSLEDALTGLYNRNRYNQVTERLTLRPPRRLGVVCLDINGLKEWNDRFGHAAGDDLIRRTAACLSSVFAGQSHRVGGDEFLVLDTDRDEAAFLQAVEQVRSALEDAGVNAAVGASWRGENCHVHVQVGEADRRMYQAKAAFYHSRKPDPASAAAPGPDYAVLDGRQGGETS